MLYEVITLTPFPTALNRNPRGGGPGRRDRKRLRDDEVVGQVFSRADLATHP